MSTMRSFHSFSPRCSLLLLLVLLVPASRGLKLGDLFSQGKAPAGNQDCSRTCESKYCTEQGILFLKRTEQSTLIELLVAPVLRYGKYCGILYSGCPGEKPCDALDACCMVHDHCVDAHNNDYLNTKCNEDLLRCIDRVSPAGPTFPGNKCDVGEVAFVIKGVIETAVLSGKILHKRDIGQ